MTMTSSPILILYRRRTADTAAGHRQDARHRGGFLSGSRADYKISTLNKIRRVLEGTGVEFIDDDAEHGPVVRL
jgi:hypothetical protein